VFDKYFSKISGFFCAHKRIFLSAIIALLVFCSIRAFFIQYDNSIELMLPQERGIVLSMRFLRHSHLSDKVVISLGLNSPDKSVKDLIAVVDKLSSELKSPLVSKVSSGLTDNNPQEQIISFLNFTPQLINSKELTKFDSQLNDAGVKQALKNDYNKLLTPGGSFMLPFISSDPLGISSGLLRKLNAMSAVLGQGVVLEDGHFLSLDRRHALLILDTQIPLTDGFGSRKLVNFLTQKLKTLPDFISADIVAGHMHSVSNEDVIKNDIQRTVTIAMIAFLAVFLLTFKDVRAFIFLLIPLGAVVIALNISAFIFGKLSYFVIGLGAVIIGVADDYGIHTYVAVRTKGSRDAVKHVAKPLVIAALTTISIFVTFFFSSVQGYHQLAAFSIATILLCLFFVLLVFPHCLKESYPSVSQPQNKKEERRVVADKAWILIWVLSMIVLLVFSFRLRFNSDITQLDGSTKEVLTAEDNFKRIYNRYENPAMLVVFNTDMEQALERNEEVYTQVAGLVGEDNLTSFAKLWPSLKTRRANVAFWQDFWQQGRQEKLKSLLSKYSGDYGFSKDAFQPFFLKLYSGTDTSKTPDDLEIFKNMQERFVQRDGKMWQVVSFFPDKDKFVRPLIKFTKKNPDTLVVSRRAFSQEISDSISHEVRRLAVIAIILVTILTAFLLKDIKLTLISLLAVVSAIITITGTFAILNKPINVAVIISSMMVIGLCIDYGVFMLYSFKHPSNTGTVKAIWVSALTTLIGAFSLLFARHPVLFSIGLTLVSGLTSGYICSQTVIPALYRVLIVKNE
jgi:predicted exporter